MENRIISNNELKSELNSESIFFLAYGLYIAYCILLRTMFAKYLTESIGSIVTVICVLLILLREVMHRRNTRKGIVVGIICIILAVITWQRYSYVSGVLFLLIYAARDIRFDKIAKFTIKISTILLIFILISMYCGIIDNYTFTGYRDNNVYKQRNSMGFLYALYPSTIFFNITALEVFLRREDIKWKHLVLLSLGNYYFYYFTDSRLCFYTSMILLLFISFRKLIHSNKDEKKHKIYGVLTLAYLLSFAVSWFLTIGYTSGISWISRMPESIIGRLKMNQIAILKYGISLFGQKMSLSGSGLNLYGEKSVSKYFYVDNLYVQVLLRYGIVFIILLLLLYTLAMFICYKKKEYVLLVILAMLAVHGTVDDLILYLDFNTFWFTITMLVVENGKLLGRHQAVKNRKKNRINAGGGKNETKNINYINSSL